MIYSLNMNHPNRPGIILAIMYALVDMTVLELLPATDANGLYTIHVQASLFAHTAILMSVLPSVKPLEVLTLFAIIILSFPNTDIWSMRNVMP